MYFGSKTNYLKPITLKVDNLLAQYLYQYKKLSLTGIGIFTLDDAAVLSDDNAKTKAPIEGISFVSKLISQFDDSLIEFNKLQSGKMKALAQADLDSYVMLAHQFLNIGKPFYLEGIGTLQKNRDGSFNFHPGTSLPVKSEENDPKKKTGSADETNDAQEKCSINYRGLILGAGIIATLLVVAWGGYYLYNKNTDSNTAAQKQQCKDHGRLTGNQKHFRIPPTSNQNTRACDNTLQHLHTDNQPPLPALPQIRLLPWHMPRKTGLSLCWKPLIKEGRSCGMRI